MLNTSARLLRLLSLLQSGRDWTGTEIAERLSVSSRTIRADVDRLRSLGYTVDAVPGKGGGYRLGAGAALPPLLFDDEEAIAIWIALATAVGGVAGFADSAASAQAKLDQALPARLRHRLSTLRGATVSPPREPAGVDSATLSAIAEAVKAHERLRFDYPADDDESVRRTAEPYRLVHTRGHWYLAGWDDDQADWRAYRTDRMRLRTPNGSRFTPRAEPARGLAGLVERAVGQASWRYRTRAVVEVSAERLITRVPPAVLVEALDDEHCVAHVGADDPGELCLWMGLMNADFTVPDAPELAAPLHRLSARYARASASAGAGQ